MYTLFSELCSKTFSGICINDPNFCYNVSQKIRSPEVTDCLSTKGLRGIRRHRLSNVIKISNFATSYNYTPNGYIVTMEFRVHFFLA